MTTLRPLKILLLSICVVGLPAGSFWMGGLFLDAANRGKDVRSQGKFAKLEFMLLAYHQEHGAFPPTKFQHKPGGPIHSWRVLLVPYTLPVFIERYSKYDFSQEWNSTNNLQALGSMPYFGYFSMNVAGDTTHYFAIGNDDDWPARKALKSLLVKKGEDRFLLVEYPDSELHWMEPKY